jgi:HD-GYP domain-containing protein (c-di-GMP phosphodiesterase class II)
MARVLVLDPDVHRAEALVDFFEGEGHRVSMVHSFDMALPILGGEKFDFLVVDGSALVVDTSDPLSVLTDLEINPRMFVLVSDAQAAEIKTLAKEHSFRCFTKPVAVESLLRAMRRAWNDDIEELSLPEGVEALLEAMEVKDHYTAGHGERVGELARMIARDLGLAEEEVECIYLAGRLHDIGKLVLDSVELSKPGPLTVEEFERLKRHPLDGEELLAPYPSLDVILPAIGGHHERLDGAGYPRGLPAAEIPIMARIVTVADAYDAMTTDRAYRAACGHEDAMTELRRCAGTQFDPAVVTALENVLEALEDQAS